MYFGSMINTESREEKEAVSYNSKKKKFKIGNNKFILLFEFEKKQMDINVNWCTIGAIHLLW